MLLTVSGHVNTGFINSAVYVERQLYNSPAAVCACVCMCVCVCVCACVCVCFPESGWNLSTLTGQAPDLVLKQPVGKEAQP